MLDDAGRKAWATSVIEKLVNKWEDTTCNELSNVCNSGLECRNEVFIKVIDELRESWANSLKTIDSFISAGRKDVQDLIDGAYDKAYECDPWCTCDNISVEYNEISRI